MVVAPRHCLGLILAVGLLSGCSSSGNGGGSAGGPGSGGFGNTSSGGAGSGGLLVDSGSGGDAAAGGGGVSGAAMTCDQKAAGCASQFGSLFTKTNGRADGSLVAVVRPEDQQCALPNSTHVTLQLSIQGQVQRLVVSVDGIAFTTVNKALLGPTYSEGWHVDQHIDYATDLGVHSSDFTDLSLEQAVDSICSHLEVGSPISVFAYSDGSKPSSAHQIHRNDKYPDGAIVVNPTSALPTYLLFRYSNQIF